VVGVVAQTEVAVTFDASASKVWNFIRNLKALTGCLAGAEEISILDDRTVEFTIKRKIGVVPLALRLRSMVSIEDPPHRLYMIAQGEHVNIAVDVTLTEEQGSTKFRANISVTALGPLKAIIESIFRQRSEEEAKEFAHCLKEHLQ